MPADYHLHTALCGHAEGDLDQYVAAARARQIAEICFADHAPAPDGYDSAHRMTLDEFPVYREMVGRAREARDLTVLFGIEADYYEGCERFLRDWLPAQNFDLVLGSVHFIGDWGFDSPEHRHVWDTVDVPGAWRRYFELVTRLADTRLFDVLAHPDVPKKFGYRPTEKEIREMIQPALDRVAEAGMGMEINTSGLRKTVREIYPSPAFLDAARRRGIPIVFGSDAHSPSDVGSGFDAAVRLARDAGYTHCAKFRGRRRDLVPIV